MISSPRVRRGLPPALRAFSILAAMTLATCSPDGQGSAPETEPVSPESVGAGGLAPASEVAPIVTTRQGALRGDFEQGVFAFKGVPYGASTAGERRFKRPEPAASWEGVREATAFGAICPQRGVVAEGRPASSPFGEIPKLAMGEDCLVLNLWTPALDQAERPVMVWLHGRGFESGAGSEPMYDGTELARDRDLVVVTINHRLNGFGYLYLDELGGEAFAGSGQAGMLDAVLALEWVRDNVRNFGGDPARVTIFGESGGGAKVSTLLAMPAAQGLFHRAIIQSGPGLRGVPAEAGTAAARAVLAELEIDPAKVGELAQVPLDKLQDAIAKVGANAATQFRPVVDGQVLPQNPFDPVAAPSAAGIPVMIGSNHDEAALFLLQDPKRGSLTDAELVERVQASLGDAAEPVLSVYRRTRPDASPWDLLIALATERTRLGSVLLAERQAAASDAPVFMYRFDWESDFAGGFLKAAHGLEIPFVFNHPDRVPWTGSAPGQAELASTMSRAWAAFARTGDPNHDGMPEWKPYTAESRHTMLFADQSRSVEDPDSEERLAWKDVGPVRFR